MSDKKSKFIVHIQKRYGDLDALGHVNNAVYLTYCELGRLEFFKKHFNVSGDYDFVVANVNIDFKKSIHFNDEVYVTTGIKKIGRTSCVTTHEIRGRESDELFSRADIVLVWVDRNGMKKEIPENIREKLGLFLVENEEGV
ncbi:acyl-CoA thioesterase [Caldiplasma sukawensis]